MKRVLNILTLCTLPLVFVLYSCSKSEPFEVRARRINVNSTPTIPPLPPPNPYPNSPFLHLQFPNSWEQSIRQGDSVYNWINFYQPIFNSNSVTGNSIDSLSILESNGNIINILDTINNGGFFHQEILHAWLPGPGWEYEWILQVYYKGRANPYVSYPPTGRLTIRFR